MGDGGWWMVGGGWGIVVVGGRLRRATVRWLVVDGGWWVVDGGWWMANSVRGWWMAGSVGNVFAIHHPPSTTTIHHPPSTAHHSPVVLTVFPSLPRLAVTKTGGFDGGRRWADGDANKHGYWISGQDRRRLHRVF